MGGKISPPSHSDATSADMDDDDEAGNEESNVNRQTAMLSLDVMARVMGRRHQSAFIGVLEDITDVVAGDGPGSLAGELSERAGRLRSPRTWSCPLFIVGVIGGRSVVPAVTCSK